MDDSFGKGLSLLTSDRRHRKMTLKSRKMNFPRSKDMVNNIKLKAFIF